MTRAASHYLDATDDRRLMRCVDALRSLNPEIVELARPDLDALAASALATAEPTVAVTALYDYFADLLPDLLAQYESSPVKLAEKAVLGDFYHVVSRLAKRLLATSPESPAVGTPSANTLALVPATLYAADQWCRITSHADLPAEILTAVDAAQRRHALVESVFEVLFGYLLRLSPEAALVAQLAIARRADPPVDPDIARDLLRAWRRRDCFAPEVLRQALAWSSDEAAYRHWPEVAAEADRLLRRAFLTRLAADVARTGEAHRLQRLAPFHDDDRLRRWQQRTIDSLGACIDSFCEHDEKLARAANAGADATVIAGVGDQDDAHWRRISSMFRDLLWLANTMPTVLLLSDLLLASPNGAREFSLAIFGFTTEARQTWRSHLEAQSAKLIRRCFVYDLKHGRSPVETIRRLCFGDPDLERELLAELDLISRTFDSLKQRERVVLRLAPVYASFKEPTLMATELGRRYRRLMRVLHEDHLSQVLAPEQLVELEPLRHVLLDLSVLAADCRRYLSSRNAIEKATIELLAEEMDFVMRLRRMRIAWIKRLLPLPPHAPDSDHTAAKAGVIERRSQI